MSSTSFPEDLAAYTASRLANFRIALLWLGITASALFLARVPASIPLIALLAALLIAQFRLWDDLADRIHDAALHPQRVLVVSCHVRSFALLCALLSLPAAGLLAYNFGNTHLFAYTALLAVMAALYTLSKNLPRLLRAHLVLLKYPAFIWLSAPDADPVRWFRFGACAYLALSLFEIASDSSLRHGPAWRWLAALQASALVALLIF